MDELSSLSRHSYFEPTLFGLIGLSLLFLCSRLVYHVSYRYAGDNELVTAMIMAAVAIVSLFIDFLLLIPIKYYIDDLWIYLILSLLSPPTIMMAILGIAMYLREYDDTRTATRIIEELGT